MIRVTTAYIGSPDRPRDFLGALEAQGDKGILGWGYRCITDKPGGRKQHIGEIPLIGGIAMFIGILVAAMTTVQTTGLWTLLVPAALLVTVGVIDDRYNIRVSARLAAQTCAVLVMMIGGGLYLRDIGDPFGTGRLGLGILAIPVSVLVTLSVINAFNFIDGIDGLAASMALIGLTGAALATGLRSSAVSVAAIACGAMLGFLLFNFPAFRNRRLRTSAASYGAWPGARCRCTRGVSIFTTC